MLEQSEGKTGGKRQSEARVREEHLLRGALLLDFSIERPGLNIQALSIWKSIEKKGFLVTKSGCLIPASCHTSGNSNKKPAYETSMKLFGGKSKNPLTKGTVNEYGWPAEEQISHLCHDNSCCWFKDLEIVPQWQNLKRNYCGLKGKCDCGCKPKCKSRYMPSNTLRDYDDLLRYGDKKLGEKVRNLFEVETEDLVVKVKILDRNHYKVQDLQRINRTIRLKRKRKHDAERKKKASKRRKLIIN